MPVLVFVGPRGSGKTALLAEIGRLADQRVPFARLDCAAHEDKSVRDLLTQLAFELNRRAGTYGTLAFPRFVIGRLVLELDLDATQASRARTQVERTLEEHRKVDRLRSILGEATPELLKSIPTVGQLPAVTAVGRHLPGAALDALVKWQPGRRVVLGRAQDWYGRQDRGLHRNPLDVLVDLNRAAHSMHGNADEVDELLWAAFLADLREGFNSKHSDRRTLNCAVLLDNVDSELGEQFLARLVEARRQHAAHTAHAPDPLTVVVAARGELGTGPPVSLKGASYADYESKVDERAADDWYRVGLDNLTEEHVGNMLAGLDAHVANPRHVSRVVHRFTGGHPGSTRLLLDAVGATPGEGADLPRLLDARPGGHAPVQERIADVLLADFPDYARADLTTSAAAHDIDQALLMAAQSPFFAERRTGRSPVFSAALWRGSDGKMQPVLRRLLLRKLAVRDDDETASWYHVHGWLRHKSAASKDEGGELHHALALGEVEEVARRMSELLAVRDIHDWLELLWSVTGAPNRLEHDRSPVEQIRELTRWVDSGEQAVAATGRLIAALWIAADPLSRREELDAEIAANLSDLAPYAGDGLPVLRGEASKWSRTGAR